MSKKFPRRVKLASSKEGGVVISGDSSPLVPQRDKIGFELHIKERDDITPKQKELIDLILDKETKVVFISGPAGTSKTFVSVLAGLKLLNKRAISDLLYIRTVVESASRSLGYLPGEQGEKMEPYLRPLQDKMEEMISHHDIERLKKEKRIEGAPVNYIRGASFNAKFILVDEAQNLDIKEITTVITRLGMFSKMIIAGDPGQSDINGKSGFIKFFDWFNDEESRKNGIHCFSFTKDDIVRSGVLKYIVERIEALNQQTTKEPMFPVK